jgi:transposase
VITPEIAEHLKVLLAQDDRVWSSKTLVEYVQQTFGVSIQRTALRAQLHRLGLSWQHTRGVVAGTGDPEQKTEFTDVLDTVKKGLTWGC